MLHCERWWLGGVPAGEMAIDSHARQAINESPGGKYDIIQIHTFDKLVSRACLSQQFKHSLPNCCVLRAQAIGCLEIDERTGIDNFEMRGVGERPLQIATADRFQNGDRSIVISFGLCRSDSLRLSSHGLFGYCG